MPVIFTLKLKVLGRMPPPWRWCLVVIQGTDVSENRVALIFGIEKIRER
jgi:hypothetical protein